MEIHNLITLWLVLSKRFKVQSCVSHILKAPIVSLLRFSLLFWSLKIHLSIAFVHVPLKVPKFCTW